MEKNKELNIYVDNRNSGIWIGLVIVVILGSLNTSFLDKITKKGIIESFLGVLLYLSYAGLFIGLFLIVLSIFMSYKEGFNIFSEYQMFLKDYKSNKVFEVDKNNLYELEKLRRSLESRSENLNSIRMSFESYVNSMKKSDKVFEDNLNDGLNK